MKDEWLFPNAVVPVDTQTTLALLVEIKRLIDVQNMASESTYKSALAQQEPIPFGIRGGMAHDIGIKND